jgi:hypothetical protein
MSSDVAVDPETRLTGLVEVIVKSGRMEAVKGNAVLALSLTAVEGPLFVAVRVITGIELQETA